MGQTPDGRATETEKSLIALCFALLILGVGFSLTSIMTAREVGKLEKEVAGCSARVLLSCGPRTGQEQDVPDGGQPSTPDGGPKSSSLSRREIESFLARRAPSMDPELRRDLARIVRKESLREGLDPTLVLTVMKVESAFDPGALSPKGAIGLMQVMPETFARISGPDGGSVHDPLDNVRAGIRYLGWMHRIFGETEHALMAYNAGPRYVKYHLERTGKIPEPVREYSELVQREHEKLLKK